MDILSFLKWKKEKKPQDIIESNLADLSELGNSEAFKRYTEIIEWRIHNFAEQSLFNPTVGKTYDQGFADGQRVLLVDFKKIKEAFKKRKEQ